MKSYLFLILTLMLLTSCVSSNSKTNIPENFKFQEGGNLGVMIASLSYSGTFSGYTVYYRKLGTTENIRRLQIGQGAAGLPPGMMQWDIEKPGLRGNIFAVALTPGEYEVFNYSFSSGFSHGSTDDPVSIKFKVEPGRPTYIGNFLFKRTAGFGATVLGVDVIHGDFVYRDLSIAEMKFPLLDISNTAQPFKGIQSTTIGEN